VGGADRVKVGARLSCRGMFHMKHLELSMVSASQIALISPSSARLLIEEFLDATPDYSPTRLGREAKKDPGCIFAIRRGRDARGATIARIVDVIEGASPGFTAAFLQRVMGGGKPKDRAHAKA
jgi:hypothetical protein